MTTPRLLTLAQLRDHLGLPTLYEGSPAEVVDSPDLQMKLDAATQIVCDYLIGDQNPPDEDWVAEIESWDINASPLVDSPAIVRLAVLEQAAELHRFRGDDAGNDDLTRDRDMISPSVGNLLTKYRRPSFA